MEFKHIPVMLHECIDALNIKEGGIYVDGTLGGAGHSFEIAKRLTSGRLVGIDRDSEAIEAASKRLSDFGDRVITVKNNFKNIKEILPSIDIESIDGALLDLGVSSHQLDEASRGFSYMHDAPLDMRMNQEERLSAYDVVNDYEAERLEKILFEYGEEKWAKRIVSFIMERRKNGPIKTTGELSDIVKAAIPKGARADGGHPAKRTFQAIRIEVNGELEMLAGAVNDFTDVLKPGGRLLVITFHSLEDRIVKDVFLSAQKGCICPPDFPVCVCGRKPRGKVITKKPIIASEKETELNPRSKSAKLRIFEKI